MFIQTEETPNPNTLKFLPGKVILKEDSLEFKTKDEAKSNIFGALSCTDKRLYVQAECTPICNFAKWTAKESMFG